MAINLSTKHYKTSSMTDDNKYTEQEWDKAIGWDKVPEDKKKQPDLPLDKQVLYKNFWKKDEQDNS